MMPVSLSTSSPGPEIAALLVVTIVSVAAAAGIQLVLRLRRDALAARLRLVAPWAPALAPAEPARTVREHEGPAPRLARLSQQALGRFHLPARMAMAIVPFLRLVTTIAAGLLAWWIGSLLLPAPEALPLRALLVAAAAVLGWFAPTLLERELERRHREAVLAGLPDALDLLVICAEGGLALADAIERVGGKLREARPELADELDRISADLKILPSQDEALGRFAVRINTPVTRSLVNSLSQTMRYGTPLAEAMRTAAAGLRNEALLRMQERINRLPALMTVPMIVFILPTVILIAGGPAALKTIDILFR